MNLIRVLGSVAFAVGGSLLLSEAVFGQEIVSETTGLPTTILRISCVVVSLLGAAALRLGAGDAEESAAPNNASNRR